MPFIDTPVTLLALVAVLAYLLGSVPFGLLVARAMGLPDPRGIGSKNIGATNVLRTGSKPAAVATLLLDAAKGLGAVFAARAVAGEDAAQVAALAAFLGHCYTVFLRFRGGKGVATYLGALFGLSFTLGLVASLVWLATCAATRYSSLSSIATAASAPVIAWIVGRADLVLLLFLLALILIRKHRENIARLRDGTESKVGAKSV